MAAEEVKCAETELVHLVTEKLQTSQFPIKDVDKTSVFKNKTERGCSEKQKQSGRVSYRYCCCEKQSQKALAVNLGSTLTI